MSISSSWRNFIRTEGILFWVQLWHQNLQNNFFVHRCFQPLGWSIPRIKRNDIFKLGSKKIKLELSYLIAVNWKSMIYLRLVELFWIIGFWLGWPNNNLCTRRFKKTKDIRWKPIILVLKHQVSSYCAIMSHTSMSNLENGTISFHLEKYLW